MPAQGINFEKAQLISPGVEEVGALTPAKRIEREYLRVPAPDAVLVRRHHHTQDANFRASILTAAPHGPDSTGPKVVDTYAPNPFGLPGARHVME